MSVHSRKSMNSLSTSPVGSTRPRRALLHLCAAWLLGGIATTAGAAEYKHASTQNYLVQPAPAVTLETATAIIRHKTGGRVLSANAASKGTEVGYQVRVLVDERLVQTWFVDDKGRAENE